MQEPILNYDTKEYQRSRKAYITQSAFQYCVTLLVTDSFLANLLNEIGISDSMIGVISSFISVAFVIQLMSIFLIKVRIETKKLVILFDTLSIFFFMLLYLIPFFGVSKKIKTAFVIVSIIAAYAGNYMISSICFKWANSYVDPKKRAGYSARKEMISLAVGMIFSLGVGYVIDRYEDIGNRKGSFLFIAGVILILNIGNLLSYLMIKKENGEWRYEKSQSYKAVFNNTLGNRNFRNVILLTVLWNMAIYFTTGFMGIFKTKDLLFSMVAVQGINVAASLLRIFVSEPMGKYSDKHSYVKGFKLGLYLAAAAFLFGVFTTRSTRFLIVIHTLLYHCCLAGTNQNSFNMTYSYVEEKYITQAMAIKNSIGGICGFGASIAAGRVLELIQENGNRIGNMQIYGQQVLSMVSLMLVVGTILFINQKFES